MPIKNKMLLSRESKSGFAIILVMALMIFLSAIGVAIVYLVRDENKKSIFQKSTDVAVYLADAGIEFAIDRLRNASLTSATTDNYRFGDGVFQTTVTVVGTSTYQIKSDGYMPNKTNPVSKKRVTALVKISQEISPFALKSGTGINFAKDSVIKGDIRANGQITIPSGCEITTNGSGEGGNIYTNADGGATSDAINIATPFTESVSNCNFRSRGDLSDNLINKTGMIGAGVATLTVTEFDTSEYTDYMDLISEFPSISLDELAEEVDVTYESWLKITGTFDLAGRTLMCKGGVSFESTCVIVGSGTVWVPTKVGNAASAINIDKEFGSVSSACQINMIVSGGAWGTDINILKDSYINGYVYGRAMVDINKAFTITGIIECAGSIDMAKNISLTYDDNILNLPASEAGATVLSWVQSNIQ